MAIITLLIAANIVVCAKALSRCIPCRIVVLPYDNSIAQAPTDKIMKSVV